MILPDADLYHLNFESLISSNTGTDFANLPYLIHRYNISYLLSASVAIQQQNVARQKGYKNNNKAVLLTPVFTDEMKNDYKQGDSRDTVFSSLYRQPFALKAAESIHGILPSDHLVHQAADENTFKKLAQRYKIIHLGTHALIDDNNPLQSRFYLARSKKESAQQEDGVLHAYEIYPLQLKAELAVLTACESGKGAIRYGEGVMSLTHSFMFAGCPSVVMSLWKIAEKTSAEIITDFYRYLKKGHTKSDALRAAKLHFMKTHNGLQSNPFFSAGLSLIGSDQPLYRSNKTYWIIALAALFGLAATAAIWLPKKIVGKWAGLVMFS